MIPLNDIIAEGGNNATTAGSLTNLMNFRLQWSQPLTTLRTGIQRHQQKNYTAGYNGWRQAVTVGLCV